VSSIAITVTEPGGSPNDITDDCVFERCSFSQQMNAVPGQFRVLVRDPNQTHSFVTGSEITLEVDGALVFGGYVTLVEDGHFAPAADASDLANYDLRTFTLSGSDYNIIFDRRVWRNTSDYYHLIDLSAFTTDGDILREALSNYADLSDFDTTSGIVDIDTTSFPTGDSLQQGEAIREEFKRLAQFGGAVWYSDPTRTFIYKPYDDVVKRWGFSDNPNHNAITASPTTYQGATTGFREVTGTEDAQYMVNDALVWGGSQWAGTSGGTVFARVTDATSITDHGRWQTGEAHFGERLFSIQDQVDARASVIVNGPPGADATGQQKGLKNPQTQFEFTWFSDDVPTLSGVPDHLKPGDILNIELTTFGVTTLLPLRQLQIEFPDAFEIDGTHKVKFTGTFGLQLSDPYSLWAFLQSIRGGQITQVQSPAIVTDSSTSTTYGASYSGAVSPAPDNSTTVFSIPFGYITGSLAVYINGLLQRPGTDFNETDNAAGTFTMTSAPVTTDTLVATALTLSS
jgi:hypothetical protein